MSLRVSHTLKIIGLAILTFGIAGLITFAFPRWSILQRAIQQPSTPIIITPDTAPQMITFDGLRPNDRLKPNQVITGTAPGRWFFEASFPVELQDAQGNTFWTVPATTGEDWMTTKNVQFTVTLPDHFDYTGIGTIHLKKDDPSGGEALWNPVTDEKTVPVIFENE